jgi:carotenoid cleavage dioxygenase-like enzyme
MLKVEREIPLRITPDSNPFLTGLFAPVSREITADELSVIGEIPQDLEGVYLRNGPNPIFASRGRYHWFDGDEIIMDACRVVEPRPKSASGEGELARMQAFLRLEAQLWRWRFNLKTGAVKEEQLDGPRPNGRR